METCPMIILWNYSAVRTGCSYAARRVMRLFFPSVGVSLRIIRVRYFFTLDVPRRTSCYLRIVTVKRECYDRQRAPFCGFPRRENRPRRREKRALSSPAHPSSLPPRRHQIPLTLILLSMDAENSASLFCSFQRPRPD